MKKIIVIGLAAISMFIISGCEIQDVIDDWDNSNDNNNEETGYVDAINPSDVTWLGVNVGPWEKTYDLKVSLRGSFIVYDQEATANWTPKNEAGVMASANPWVIAKINGKWYAATHEWMRVNQREKGKRSVHGDHIKHPIFGPDWTPTVGEEYGFTVSGLCRGSQRNESERTPIVIMIWQ